MMTSSFRRRLRCLMGTTAVVVAIAGCRTPPPVELPEIPLHADASTRLLVYTAQLIAQGIDVRRRPEWTTVEPLPRPVTRPPKTPR